MSGIYILSKSSLKMHVWVQGRLFHAKYLINIEEIIERFQHNKFHYSIKLDIQILKYSWLPQINPCAKK
jgi:hypothetical protein